MAGDPVQRTIADVWTVTAEVRGEGHRAGMVLEPGRWSTYDPFLMMAEDWFSKGTFGDHPHRGIETVTYVIEGRLSHKDNQGGEGVLNPGDVQWMTAGRGVIHREEPEQGEVHSLQLWVNLPSDQKMTAPAYQDLRRDEMPVRCLEGGKVRVFSGTSGNAAAPTRNPVPVTMVEVELDAGASFAQDLPGSFNGFVYVLEGSGTFGSGKAAAEKGQALLMGPAREGAESVLEIRAERPLRALVFAGEPAREPVVAYGPFVMNTEEEIRQAFRDYRSGAFGA